MHQIKKNKERGLIRTLILIFIAIIILSVLGIDLKKTVESEMTQKNIGYVKATVITVWNRYLEVPVKFLWRTFIDYVWTPAIRNLNDAAETSESSGALQKTAPLQSLV